MRVFEDPGRLLEAGPTDLGCTGWETVGPAAVERFCAATGSERPGDGTVPPLMLLSLTNRFLPDLMQVPGASGGVNYGADSVSFGPPVRAGDRVRARAELADARAVSGGVQTTIVITIETDGDAEARCTVRSLSRWMT